MKVLVTGATGLIGKQLGLALHRKGHSIIVTSRDSKKAKNQLPFPCEVIECDLGKAPLKEKVSVDAVFHLMGENVTARRWNEAVKKEILDSRVLSARNLNASLTDSISFYLSSSGVGIYGDRPGISLTEQSSFDGSFLSNVCVAWEKEADQILLVQPKAKVAKIRTGIVLSSEGGALDKMLPAFKMGVGGALAGGKQYMSWIHIEDLVAMMIFAFEKNIAGAFNGVAPHPVTNKEFSKTLADVLHRPLGPSVPRFALKILFGEMAEIMCADQKASPTHALNNGFQFKYTLLKDALTQAVLAK
tara:strand:+ start:19265 stop:20170 length:906 start_codon:yes stop_codon:yes gene_type:complete